MKAIALALVLLAGLALASPALYTGAVKMEATPWNDGFSRAQGMIPLHSEILSVQRKGRVIVVHFAFDPDAPDVWRRIIMTRGVMPVPVPLDQFILERDGVYFWDEGQFASGKIAAD